LSGAPIDLFASEPQYLDHLAPVWRALPLWARGELHVPEALADYAAGLGVPAYLEPMRSGRRVLVASYNDLKAVRKSSPRAIAYIEHGIGQSYAGDPHHATGESYAGGKDHHDVSLFLTPNEHSAGRWREAYPRATVTVVGSPKVREIPLAFPGPPPERPVVAVSWHSHLKFAPETESAYWEFRDAAAALPYEVLGHGHPRAFASGYLELEAFYRSKGIEVVRDFDEVLARADLYVCDNSSTIFEFAATGRPVVLMNASRYRRNVHHGLRFWEAATVGLQCDNPAELERVVAEALTDPPEVRAARDAALDLVYAYRGEAAERTAEALVAWAGLAPPVRPGMLAHGPEPIRPT
jgi:hypothetical protein